MVNQSRLLHDDLGAAVELPRGGPRRIVSLVPSLTEAVALTAPDRLVGATDWCTHPADLDVPRVRGTKNPDLAAIAALRPDLVLGNQEENRLLDVERLRQRGIPVWVTVVESLDQSLAALRRLFVEVLAGDPPGWLLEAEEVWAPREAVRRRVAVPVWRDPWMVVGARTYTGDLVRRLGFTNVFDRPDAGRYPHVDLARIRAEAELVILPDEPYAFGPDDGPECFTATEASPAVDTVCVDGRDLTWYGPAMVGARARLEEALAPWRG
jgi:ABC-type Fe3+-hydroxamate transport system substrate-binding protein